MSATTIEATAGFVHSSYYLQDRYIIKDTSSQKLIIHYPLPHSQMTFEKAMFIVSYCHLTAAKWSLGVYKLDIM